MVKFDERYIHNRNSPENIPILRRLKMFILKSNDYLLFCKRSLVFRASSIAFDDFANMFEQTFTGFVNNT